MNNFSAWWSRVGLQLKLQILIQGFLILILLPAQLWLAQQIEQRTVSEARARATVVADGVVNSLNTLMDTEIKGKDVISDEKARATFIRKVSVSDNLKEVRAIRGKGTTDEFGPGLPQEQAQDDQDRAALSSGQPSFQLQENGNVSLMRAVIPMIAMKEFRGSHCLECHGVDAGVALGAVSVTTDISDDMNTLRRVNLWIWGGQLALQVCLFLVISQIVKHQLAQLGAEPRDAAELAQNVARGDLSTPIAVQAGDTHSMMAQLLYMQQSLTRIVSRVRQNSEGVATASAEIAQGNSDLSARTEQQASALEQTAASMEELASTVRNNADAAREANQLAQNASEVATKGGGVVTQVVDTMKDINAASHRIAAIIGVIDGIAFQTNILALNAAVEAARAGEQGRGFAVVASEVRLLAGRSAEAAREIKSLISASVERVEQGTALVDQAGATMVEVVQSIQRVTEIMAGITSASNEQAQGVAQVGEAVTQMDQATQQNAALVEQMAAAAASLKSLADELVHAVSVFKLDPRAA